MCLVSDDTLMNTLVVYEITSHLYISKQDILLLFQKLTFIFLRIHFRIHEFTECIRLDLFIINVHIHVLLYYVYVVQFVFLLSFNIIM